MAGSEARLETLLRRLTAEPGSRVFVSVAEEYRQLGRLREAIQTLVQGLELQPGYLAARVALGRLQLEAGRTDDGIRTLSGVIRTDRTQMVACRLLIGAYGESGQVEAATRTLEQYRLLNPQDPDLPELGRIAQGLSDESASGRSEGADARETGSTRRLGLGEVGTGDSPSESTTTDPISDHAPKDSLAFLLEKPLGVEDSDGAADSESVEVSEGLEDPDVLGEPRPETELPDETLGEDLEQTLKEGSSVVFDLEPQPVAPDLSLMQASDSRSPTTITLAEVYLRQGHRHEAAEIYRALLEVDPSDEKARRGLRMLEEEEIARADPRRHQLNRKREALETYLMGIRLGRGVDAAS